MRSSIAPSRAALLSVTVCILSCVAGCGGEPPPKAPETSQQEEAPPPMRKPSLKMKSELGSVDPAAVKKRLRRAGRQVHGLPEARARSGRGALRQREVLPPHRRGRRGAVDVPRGQRARGPRHREVPARRGARARSGRSPTAATPRPATAWSCPCSPRAPRTTGTRTRSRAALGKHGERHRPSARRERPAKFHATMYVGPGGKVLAAGVATSTQGRRREGGLPDGRAAQDEGAAIARELAGEGRLRSLNDRGPTTEAGGGWISPRTRRRPSCRRRRATSPSAPSSRERLPLTPPRRSRVTSCAASESSG